MGKQTVTRYVDDHTGKEVAADDVVAVILTVAVDGETPQRWELCYAAESAKALTAALAKFTGDAEPTAGYRLPLKSEGRGSREGNPDNVPIRKWWHSLTPGQRVDHGNLPVGKDKGRIPEAVTSAWNALPEDKRAEYL